MLEIDKICGILHHPFILEHAYRKIRVGGISHHPLILEHAYRKILNISPGPTEVRKHFLSGFRGGYIQGGLIFRGHFVLVSEYQDLKIHCYMLLMQKKVFLYAKITFILL